MFGPKAYKYINSAIDISDGFFGDLSKILDGKFGAKINTKSIPLSIRLKKILIKHNSLIKLEDILNWGDDYELIFTSFKKNREKLLRLSKKNRVKLSLVGSVIKKPGIYDDSLQIIKNIQSFDHFS
jgi:thiamine monophosphate kinase